MTLQRLSINHSKMNIKKIYSYIFYKLYKFSEAAPSKWWSDWKALIALEALEVWLIISIFIYYDVITKKELPDDKTIVLVGVFIIIILSLIKYFVFYHKDQWKIYVKEYDKLSKRQNKIGSALVIILIILILCNLIFSFFLMSQINWELHK